MVKTTVYLSTESKRRLAMLAKQQGRSEAELIREAVDRLVDEAAPPRPIVPLFNSGGAGIAERVDELLAEGFGRD